MDNYYYCVGKTKFRPAEERLEGGYDRYASMDDMMDWLHFYTFFLKFGMGRATAASSQEIRAGALEREEALHLIRLYDGEYPKKYLKNCLDYLELTQHEFDAVCDANRPEHLWEKTPDGWKLKQPIWDH